jgi:DNA invertase Pin-like site-specific DNA recombinase
VVFGIFAALAKFERELIRERRMAGLSPARTRGRNGGRPYTMTTAKASPGAGNDGQASHQGL